MLDVTFSFKHDCFYCDFSKEFPDTTLLVVCNNQRDIIELLSPSQKTLEAAAKRLGEKCTEAERSEKGNRIVVVTDKCLCDLHHEEETPLPPDVTLLQVSPRVYNNGWEQRRLLGFNNRHVREMVENLQGRFPMKIISKKPVTGGLFGELVSPTSNQLFGGMTERQREAVLLACREGYYKSPRAVTTEQLSKRFGTTRATYEEHLRKAENKLLRVLSPYMDTEGQATVRGKARPVMRSG